MTAGIDYWIECNIVLDGGMFIERDATACFRIDPREHGLTIETITVDGVVYQASVIEAQIGADEMADICRQVDDWWWQDDGHLLWKLGQYLNGEKFDA